MQIKIHNDGKEKRESFCATLKTEDVYACGCGESEFEAIQSLKNELTALINTLGNINFTDIIYVDCLGKPLSNQKIKTS